MKHVNCSDRPGSEGGFNIIIETKTRTVRVETLENVSPEDLDRLTDEVARYLRGVVLSTSRLIQRIKRPCRRGAGSTGVTE